MSNNPDTYYLRSEVSNSDLTALKELLHPRLQFGNREEAFRFGNLVDAIITEPARVNYYRFTVDDTQYTEDEFRHAQEMYKSLRMEARSDRFLAFVLENATTQKFMVNQSQQFEYCGFPFTLATRCKWDWWLEAALFGGDLKTTAATSQKEFEQMIDFFDWDRSRAWYMDIAHSDRDFIYAISKKNSMVFKKQITRGDAIYNAGREKYEELAFQYWCLNLCASESKVELAPALPSAAANQPQVNLCASESKVELAPALPSAAANQPQVNLCASKSKVELAPALPSAAANQPQVNLV